MKKLILIIFALTIISLAPLEANAFAGGDGSAGDPFQISTCLELQDMDTDLDASYILINDIDCSDTVNWNAGAGFEPVGDAVTPFAGTLDGQGFVISDLFIDRDIIRIGLFGQTSAAAEISNVGLEDVDIAGTHLDAAVGALAGLNAGAITTSHSTGGIDGSVVGGLFGTNSGTISNSYSRVSVTSTIGERAAGLVAVNNGTITNSYSTGAVSGGTTGGLVSFNTGTITDSFWDTETSGQATSAGGTGKTTAEMKDISTFTDTDTAGLTTAWDFLGNPNDDEAGDDDWSIDSGENNGYPFLTAFVDTVPGIPTALSATVVSDTEINLSWTAPAYDGDGTITGYQIERKVGAGSFGTLVADTGTTATTYSDTGLTAETLYTYKISTINAIGTSTASGEASATTEAAPVVENSGSTASGSSASFRQSRTSNTEQDDLTRDQRENLQNQINQIRELLTQLIELIRLKWGIVITT
jgi:hypothetical protein